MCENNFGFEREMTDKELLDVVLAFDRRSRPMEQRFDGDDQPIRDLCSRLNVRSGPVFAELIIEACLRECCARGLRIPRGNS